MRFAFLAAAGLAEAAWLYQAMLMSLGLVVIAVTAVVSLLLAARRVAIAAAVLMAAYCWLFLPWYCFAPFSPSVMDDPDVVEAINRFRIVGVAWVATLLLVVFSIVVALIRKKPRQPVILIGADPPQAPRG